METIKSERRKNQERVKPSVLPKENLYALPRKSVRALKLQQLRSKKPQECMGLI